MCRSISLIRGSRRAAAATSPTRARGVLSKQITAGEVWNWSRPHGWEGSNKRADVTARERGQHRLVRSSFNDATSATIFI